MAYADYSFYVNEYFGEAVEEEDFRRLSDRASEYICGATGGASDRVTGSNMVMIKKATCAIAEVLLDEEKLLRRSFSEDKVISSESVGSHSVSYGSPSLSSADVQCLAQRKKEILQVYLGWLFKVRSYPCTHRIP